jgi:hypothetical protein
MPPGVVRIATDRRFPQCAGSGIFAATNDGPPPRKVGLILWRYHSHGKAL